jgi:hypothetical protein
MAARPEAVWSLLSATGHLEECHPFCAANPVSEWPGVGGRDTLEYHNGRVVERHFTTWLDGTGYDIEVSDANGPVASVSWRIGAAATGSVLTVSITPRWLGEVSSALRWVLHVAIVRPMMRRYLQAVLRGVEWRVTTGEPVRRNQYGAHAWFSRRE